YTVYAIKAGKHTRQVLGTIPVDEPSYIHSFAMTPRYVILAEYPLVVNPLSMLVSGKPFIENYHWKPERGTRFLVLDKQDGSVLGPYESAPFFAFHHVNAFESGDQIVVDLCAYPDPTIIDDLYLENLIGPQSRAASQGELRRYRLSLGGASTKIDGYSVLSDESMDLPRINYERSNGRDYQFAYGSGRRKETPGDFLNQLVKVDVRTKETQRWFEKDCYPGEAILVPSPNATGEDEGVVLSIVLDGRKGTSFLLVLDAPSFTEIARAEVPHHIPFALHGIYTAS
ncbi:MAG: carotenoid oxygenase family protein, partial [Ktedonobacterales bacterium]